MSLTHIREQISQITSEINEAQQSSSCEKTEVLIKQLFDLLQQLPNPNLAISKQDNTLLRKTLTEALGATKLATTRYQSWQQDIAALLKAFGHQDKP